MARLLEIPFECVKVSECANFFFVTFRSHTPEELEFEVTIAKPGKNPFSVGQGVRLGFDEA